MQTMLPESDPGRRLSEAHNIAQVAGGQGRWIAARLSDGGTDGTVYDSRADAVRHQLHETQCLYVRIHPTRMTPAEATRLLGVARQAYAAGFKLADPETHPLMGRAVMRPGRILRRG